MRFAVSNDVRHIVEVGDTIRFTKVPHDNYRAEFYAYSEGIIVAKIVHGITNINGQPGFVPNTDKLSYSHAFKMPDFIDVKVVDIFDDYHFIVEYDENHPIVDENYYVNTRMDSVPNLEMREVDNRLLAYAMYQAIQGVNIEIKVNDPKSINARRGFDNRVCCEMILAQRNNYNKVILRAYTCAGSDSNDIVYMDVFHVVKDDYDSLREPFFDGCWQSFEHAANNFAYVHMDNIEMAVNQVRERAKNLIFIDREVHIK